MSNQKQITERGPWKANESEGKTFIESADFTHDVRLYINGDFSDSEQRNQYAAEIARRLNAAPAASPCDADKIRALLKKPGEKYAGWGFYNDAIMDVLKLIEPPKE